MNIARTCWISAVIGFSAASAPAEDNLRHPPFTNAGTTNALAGIPKRDTPTPTLPPLPPDVTELKFADFFKLPIGPLGLEYSDKVQRLDGKRVRISGFMIRQSAPVPWAFLLSPIPATLHESEFGFSEDLPATILHVKIQRNPVPVVPYTPGLMLLTGLLSVGTQEEADGRISSVRLILDPPSTEQQHLLAELASSAKTNSTTTAPTSKPAP